MYLAHIEVAYRRHVFRGFVNLENYGRVCIQTSAYAIGQKTIFFPDVVSEEPFTRRKYLALRIAAFRFVARATGRSLKEVQTRCRLKERCDV